MSNEQSQSFIEQATQSIQGGQFSQAIELLDQAIAINPMSADAYLLKGVALAQMSSPDLATESFQKAIGIEPDNAKARFNLAVHFSRIGQKQGALTEAREALRVDPNHAGARDLVTQLEAEMGVAASTPSAPDGAPPIQGATGSTYQSNPYQSGPTASYNREGYAPKVHTLPFVERMGSTWTTLGWIFTGIALLIFVLSLSKIPVQYNLMQEAMKNPNRPPTPPPTTIFDLILQIFSVLNWICSITWIIMDIVDRKRNWLWLVLYCICCCCAPVQLIYMLAARKDDV